MSKPYTFTVKSTGWVPRESKLMTATECHMEKEDVCDLVSGWMYSSKAEAIGDGETHVIRRRITVTVTVEDV